MRYVEWLVLFIIAGCGIALANLVGFKVGLSDSLPGILVLVGISLCAVLVSKVVPLKLPIIAYCSVIGLFLACPFSPIRSFVIESAGKINFTAPLTMVGAYAGLSISDQLNNFAKQGWKMILIGFLVMTGTFVGSALVSQIMLAVTNVI